MVEQSTGAPLNVPPIRATALGGSTLWATLQPQPAPSGTQYPSSPVSYYVTTPIYYVNAEPHLGHAYTTIAADILARHMRQRGEDVFFLTGTDEHGEPVAQAAEKLGIEPRELADRNAPRFKELMPKINASNDFFIRTTDPAARGQGPGDRPARPRQRPRLRGGLRGLVLPALRRLQDRVGAGRGQHLPDPQDPARARAGGELVLPPVDLPGAARAPLRRAPGLRAPRAPLQRGAVVHQPGGLADVSLSRPKLTWGVRLPWDPSQVIYVWFDALLNYVTALSYARDGEDLTERFWPAFHIIGKDILKFHAVYWPAFLMAAATRCRGGCSSTATC